MYRVLKNNCQPKEGTHSKETFCKNFTVTGSQCLDLYKTSVSLQLTKPKKRKVLSQTACKLSYLNLGSKHSRLFLFINLFHA